MNIQKTMQFVTLAFGFAILVSLNTAQANPLQDLQKIGLRMKQFKHVEYSYQIQTIRLYNGSDPVFRNGQIYFEANAQDTIFGFRFYNQTKASTDFYNDESIVTMYHLDSALMKKPFCDYQDGHMTRYPHVELSYAAIQNFLTDGNLSLQIDSLSRKDTLMNNEKCISYSFVANDKLVDTHKKSNGQKKINLIVNEHDLIPVEYSQKTKSMNEVVSFSNYVFDKKYPANLFQIENIPSHYKWDKYKSLLKTLETNSMAPDWKLPLVGGDSISLSGLKGKFVLLDFWFIGCGACVESIPALNALDAKHANLEVLGVNCYSKKEEPIITYCAKVGMNYKNVWNGDLITKAYKINAAPIFYLIDPAGKIIYTQIGHDEKRLTDNVEQLLQKK